MHTDSPETPAEIPQSKTPRVTFTALVKMFNAPGVGSDQPNLLTLTAGTKREMAAMLEDPMVEQVYSVIRGKPLPYRSSRRIQF